MGTYYKPQSPIQSGEDFIYPITTADQIMKSDKSRRLEQAGLIVADNSTSLGGVAAKDYALKTDTAPDSAKLGGRAPEYYIQPRNLLDNSDFRNPVNQRGVTSKTNNGYFIDRWVIYSQDEAKRVTSIDSNGLTTAGGSAVRQLVQAELVPKDMSEYTFAACRSDGHIDFPSTWKDSNGNLVCPLGSAGTYIWAALYEGRYTADTLPPYVPKGYAAELAECMRYYRVFHVGGVGKGNYIGGVWPITPLLRIDRPTSKLIGAITTTNGETTIAAGGFDARMSYIRMDCLMTSSDFNWWQATYEVSADL